MDKQSMVYPHYEILASNTKKWATHLCYNMDVPESVLWSEGSQS